MNIKQDQVLAAARNILSVVCGFLIGKGYLTADQATAASGVVLAVVPAYYAWRSASDAAQIAKASSIPGVIVSKDGVK